ncbi:hypothetical protein SAMN05421548_10717 [Paraburkholderia lycopersici]|uniref:Uncharacterized protein n=1 Tax=Paraburkholderia lycopersici TaxID=416944 RepID=A0A1G6LR99_9BURK|nr:hypothetical protein SAMN05421548_10717 [Paraburkholderia lycopersici]
MPHHSPVFDRAPCAAKRGMGLRLTVAGREGIDALRIPASNERARQFIRRALCSRRYARTTTAQKSVVIENNTVRGAPIVR